MLGGSAALALAATLSAAEPAAAEPAVPETVPSAEADASVDAPQGEEAHDPSAPDPGSERVLILPLRLAGASSDQATVIVQEMSAWIAARAGLEVMTAEEIDVLVELQRSRNLLGCADEACIAEMTHAAEARLALSGTLQGRGDRLGLNLTLVDTSTMVAVGSGDADFRSLADALEKLPELLGRVFGPRGTTPPPAAPTVAGRAMSLALFDLVPLNLAEQTARAVTQVLAGEVKRIEGVQVITRDDIVALLQLQAGRVALDCDDGTACLVEIGGALGVDLLAAGHVGLVGGTYMVSLKLIDVAQSKVVVRVQETFRGEPDQLLPAARHAGRRLLGVVSDAPGSVALASTEQQAAVRIDDRLVGTLPMPAVAGLAPGRHTVRITKEAFVDWSTDVFVEPGDTTPIWAPLLHRPKAWYEQWWVWAIAGGVLAAGTAAVIVAAQPLQGPDDGSVGVILQ